ncbi:MAG: site-2 protease family protein [Holosporales bacterium]|nr:site-2 protease family protein [Holosporales bacterium]
MLPFVILLGVVVIVHELGHLIIARANGVFCEVFSVGYGPRICEWTDRRGTKWRLSLLPLGGYVRMFGDADMSSIKEVVPIGYTDRDMDMMSAHRKKPWQRLLISIGGPAANFVFSIVVLFAVALINGVPRYSTAITVVGESVAYSAGLRSGDQVVTANTEKINDFRELREQIVKSHGDVLKIGIKRGEAIHNISIDMFEKKENKVTPISILGVSPKEIVYEKVGLWKAFKESISTTYTIAVGNISAIFKIITGSMSAKNIGGIISIFKVSSDSASAGFLSFIFIIAMISTTLGAINLLPVPVLDGGAVVIAMIEQVIGQPLNKRFVDVIFSIGLVAVVGLMVIGMWNDLMNCKAFDLLKSYFR